MSYESVIHSIDPVDFIHDNDWLEEWIETAEIVERTSRRAQPFRESAYEEIRFRILAFLVFSRCSEHVFPNGLRIMSPSGFLEQAGRLPRPTDRVRVRMTRILFRPADVWASPRNRITFLKRWAAVEPLERIEG